MTNTYMTYARIILTLLGLWFTRIEGRFIIEANSIVSMEKMPGTCSESMPLLVQEPIRW